MSYGRQYSQIWTKDPHGGAYRKAGETSAGYDALVQQPDRTVIKREPGYEKPASGPTTNFVGNHMTQGAIDLVQSDLQGRAAHTRTKTGQHTLLATLLHTGTAPAPALELEHISEHLRKLRSVIIRARVTDA